jgi:hypothetical protein
MSEEVKENKQIEEVLEKNPEGKKAGKVCVDAGVESRGTPKSPPTPPAISGTAKEQEKGR